MPPQTHTPPEQTVATSSICSATLRTRYFFNDENRVQKRAEFLFVYNAAQPIRRKGVAVFVHHRADGAPTRLGITATKKTIGDAHRRNKLRRRVREIFRLALPTLKPGYTIIVNLTRSALEMPQEKLRKNLRSAWHEAHLFVPENLLPVQPQTTSQPAPTAVQPLSIFTIIEWPLRTVVLGAVKLYRLTLSRIMPPICRFHPSCSAYGLECLQTLPFRRALPLMIWRIMRCNPLCKGGHDPVPKA